MSTEQLAADWRAGDHLAERAAVVARTVFGAPHDGLPDELYVRATRGAVVPGRTSVRLEPHADATTDTYFGRFPAAYWQRWTRVREVTVRLVASGTGHVRLVAGDSTGDPRTVDSARIEGGPVVVELTGAVTRFVDGGGLWLEPGTGAGTLTVEDVEWATGEPVARRGVAVVVCTHNRAEDCLRTLQTLVADPQAMALVERVHVVDQGTDPVADRLGFAAVAAALGDRMRYVRQANLGGAGGFTRGIVDATAAADGAHVLLMDDDIALEPETIVRLARFADHTVEPVLVGAQMLQLLHPHRLHVEAECVDLRRFRAGRPVEGAEHDLDLLTEEGRHAYLEGQYNAWWSCLVPARVVEEIGLPLPLFFQWDDIEFGLRAQAAGFPTVTLPGAGVWHADFGWKDWDDWARYFSFRNSLIVDALHGPGSGPAAARTLFAELCRYLVAMQYGLAATLIAAIDDYLRGPDCLTDGGTAALAAVRAVRADHPETQRVPAAGAPHPRRAVAEPAPSRPGLVLCRRILTQLLGRSRGEASVSAADAEWWHVSLFRAAVVTDPSQEGVKIRRRDPEEALRLLHAGTSTLLRLALRGSRVRRRYRGAAARLAGPENWARLFTS